MNLNTRDRDSREENNPLLNLQPHRLPPQSTHFDRMVEVLSYHPHSYQLNWFSSLPLFGGCPYCFQQAWKSLTVDKYNLEIIFTGYSIHFASLPSANPRSPSLFTGHSHENLLWQEKDSLLLQGAIELVPVQQRGKGFYSGYFLVPKKDGSWKPILDLRPTQHLYEGTKILDTYHRTDKHQKKPLCTSTSWNTGQSDTPVSSFYH